MFIKALQKVIKSDRVEESWDWVWIGNNSFKKYLLKVLGRGVASWVYLGKSPTGFSAFTLGEGWLTGNSFLKGVVYQYRVGSALWNIY